MKEEVLHLDTSTIRTDTPPLSRTVGSDPPPPHLNLHRLYLLKVPRFKNIHAILIRSVIYSIHHAYPVVQVLSFKAGAPVSPVELQIKHSRPSILLHHISKLGCTAKKSLLKLTVFERYTLSLLFDLSTDSVRRDEQHHHPFA